MDGVKKELLINPNIAADEMFPEGAGLDLEESGSCTGLMDLTANEKHVHADFYNDFGDLFDDCEDTPLPNNTNNSINPVSSNNN